jgi:hypothetical protein
LCLPGDVVFAAECCRRDTDDEEYFTSLIVMFCGMKSVPLIFHVFAGLAGSKSCTALARCS